MINAGTVQAELDLNAKKYNQNMEKATRVMINFGNMVKEKSKEMQMAIDAIDKKQKLWNMTTDKVTKTLRGNAKEYDTLKQKINIVTKEIDTHDKKLEEIRKEYGTSSRQAKEYEDALLDLKIQQAELNEEMEKFTIAGKLKIAGKQMQELGKSWTMKVTAPIVAASTAVTNVAMNFDAKMSEVQAISGATGEQFRTLEEKAKEMGRTTKFSASESAEALKYMAMAGWETEDMLAGIDGVMMLAAASGEDLAIVSDIVTDALSAFGMEAGQATQFADLLAKTATSSNTNVGLMGETFKYVAPIFGALGYNAEDAALAIGLMANAGIKGSQAGTVLRGAITRLVKPSKDAAGLIDELGLSLTDAHDEMLPFSDIMIQLREKFADLSEEQQAQYAATIFGQEAMSGMLTIINASEEDFNKLIDATRNYNGAAKEMADIMQDNLKGKLTELKSKLEGVALQLSKTLIPVAEKFVDKISSMVDWFSNLNPTTQEAIVKFAGLTAVMGPAAVIGGKVASGISSMVSLFKTLTPIMKTAQAATTAAGTAAEVTAGGFNLAGLAAKAGAALLNPWVLGIAAAGAGGYALYRHLSQEAIPAVDLFGDEVSESTQKAVGGFLELHDKADMALKQLSWSGQEVTKEMATEITGTFDSMKEQILESLSQQHKESYSKLQEYFANSNALTAEEEAEILGKMELSHQGQIMSIEAKNMKIQAIMQKASIENRKLTKEEQEEINKIQEEMKETGIKVLSESEKEQRIILSRMKNNAETLSAKQAAEVVKNSKGQTDKTIAEAERQRDEVIAEIEYQRDELKTITHDQAEKVIADAERQCNETITNAKYMHGEVVRHAQEQAKEHIHEVDWSTGEIKTKWQAMLDKHREKVRKQRKLDEQRAEQNRKHLQDMIDNTKQKAGEMATAAIEKYEEMKSGTLKKMGEMKTSAIQKWEELKNDAITWGSNIVQGLVDGITSMGSTLKANVEKFIDDNIPGPIKKILGIASPSKLMALYGQYVAEGLAEGIKNNGDKVSNESNKLAEVISSAMNKVNNYATNTVSIIEKKFQLWALQNNIVKDSSEYLSQQLEVQKQKHEVLNEQIKATQDALARIIEKYGEGSSQAAEYKNQLLTLKIAQEELKSSVEKTTEKIKAQTEAMKEQFEVIKAGRTTTFKSGDKFVSSSGGGKSGSWYTWTGSDGKTKSGSKSDFDKDTGYDVDDSEVRRIARDNNVDMGVARDMAAANERRKRKGKKPEYHDGGWVGKPLFDIENMLALIQKRLRYNEIAGILQEGEFVLSRDTLERIQGAMTSVDMVTTPRTTSSTPTAAASTPAKGGDIHQHITINSPEPLSPSEIARKNLQVSRQLAMEWGL